MARSAEKRPVKAGAPSLVAGADENGRAEHLGTVHMTELDYIRGLIEAVDQSGIDRLDVSRAEVRIRIAKTPASAPPGWTSYPAAAPAPGFAAPQPTAAPPLAPAETAEAAPAPKSNLIDVTSPMVGTFYRAPAPEAPPYVEAGTAVSKGQTLCILEAMKLMNELPSELDGIVREILVEDAHPVEYGQVLFRIQPNGK